MYYPKMDQSFADVIESKDGEVVNLINDCYITGTTTANKFVSMYFSNASTFYITY